MPDKPAAPPGWRLFLAAPLPADASGAIWSELDALRERYPDVRWAKLDQLHVTLLFMGQTDPDDVARVDEAMSLTALQHAPFATTTGEAGGRADDRRGGVAWLRLDDHRRAIRNLARELDWRIGTNVYATARPRPHVTVARRVTEAMLADLRAVAPSVQVTFTSDRIVLYRSHGEPGGSRYEAIAERLLTAPVLGS